VTEQHPHQFERGTDGPKVIVVGVDGSDSSLRAAAYAAGLARRQRALLALVYIQPVMAAGAALGAPVAATTDEIAEDLVRQIREGTEQVKGIFDVRWEFHTFRGDPYNGLVSAADQLKADAVTVRRTVRRRDRPSAASPSCAPCPRAAPAMPYGHDGRTHAHQTERPPSTSSPHCSASTAGRSSRCCSGSATATASAPRISSRRPSYGPGSTPRRCAPTTSSPYGPGC
jgi:nucleotide-binding universal stress UspA family protein